MFRYFIHTYKSLPKNKNYLNKLPIPIKKSAASYCSEANQKPYIIPSLPKLIFGENHSDPATGTLLQAMTPQLKKLGYTTFYDEVPKDITLQWHFNNLEEYKKAYAFVEKDFKSRGYDLNKSDDIWLYAYCSLPAELRKVSVETVLPLVNKLYSHYLDVIRRYKASLTLNDFFHVLQKEKISYIGIDHPITRDIASSGHGEIIPLLSSLRDKTMAQQYLSTDQAVFGRTGNAHVQGLQQEISNQLTQDSASASFSFFNLYSPAFKNSYWIHQPAPKLYPLKLTSIEFSEKNKSGIIANILNDIELKKIQLAELKRSKAPLVFSCFNLFSSPTANKTEVIETRPEQSEGSSSKFLSIDRQA